MLGSLFGVRAGFAGPDPQKLNALRIRSPKGLMGIYPLLLNPRCSWQVHVPPVVDKWYQASEPRLHTPIAAAFPNRTQRHEAP